MLAGVLITRPVTGHDFPIGFDHVSVLLSQVHTIGFDLLFTFECFNRKNDFWFHFLVATYGSSFFVEDIDKMPA